MRDTLPDERLWIEVRLDAEPISGAVHLRPEITRPFVGWLELVAVVEASLRGDRPAPES